MKIAIVAPSPVPFVIGGAEKLWWGLLNALNRRPGVQADLIKLPSPERTFPEIVRSYRQFMELDLSGFDVVISTKYPAWMIDHPCHIVYLQHRLRGLYDTYHFCGQPVAVPDEFRRDARLKRLFELLAEPASRTNAKNVLNEVQRLLDSLGDEASRVFEFPGPLVRAVVHQLDAAGVDTRCVKGFAAISRNVAGREGYFPAGVHVRVVHHPSDLEVEKVGSDSEVESGSANLTPRFPNRNPSALPDQNRPPHIIFTVSRLDTPKRIDLLIQAYRQVQTDIPFVIAGSGPDARRLHELARGDSRIHFTGRLPDEDIVKAYHAALFVPFVPYDEDYGLITVEAMSCGRTILTTTDAGGVNEFVVNGQTGLSVPPDVNALAVAMQRLCDDPVHTLAMGQAARAAVAHVDWGNTVNELLALIPAVVLQRVDAPVAASDPASDVPMACLRVAQTSGASMSSSAIDHDRACAAKALRRVLLVSPFPVWPPVSGGQLRTWHMARVLSERMSVHVFSLSIDRCEPREHRFTERLRETVVPPSEGLRQFFESMHRALGVDCGDIALFDGILKHEDYLWQLRREADAADWVVCSHPYLYPAVKAVTRGRLVYDAHNVEADMKAVVLRSAATGSGAGSVESGSGSANQTSSSLLDRVAQEEGALYRAAQVVSACSADDLRRFNELYARTSDAQAVHGPGAQQPRPQCVEVPNGVDTAAIEFTGLADKRQWQRRTGLSASGELALFAASWHGPNIEAMELVIELARQRPALPIVVLGTIGQHPVCQNLPANIRAVGRISDAEKTILLRAASLLLNPMRSGSGTNLKMLEYAASGGTIVSSPWGNRGLDFVDGTQIVIADCDAFVAGVDRALSLDIAVRQKMAQSARQTVEQRFDWRTGVGRLAEILLG